VSLRRKINQISRNAELAAKLINVHIYDHDIFEENGGYIFSWMIGTGPMILNLYKDALHVGFALSPSNINDQYHLADVNYFITMFREELAKHGNDTPEIRLDKIEYSDKSGLSLLTVDDLEGKNEAPEET
jgi:hypothetical protein